jgi:hypothetical protein
MKRIDKLLAAMTVGEKIGQLNMMAAVTGQVLASGAAKDIRAAVVTSALVRLGLWRLSFMMKLRPGGRGRHRVRIAIE